MATGYLEKDRYICSWLKELVSSGRIEFGTVACQDIRKVEANDPLLECDRLHLFAGIGGWALALDWAGYTGPAWTLSCPCQPFSRAGTKKGTDDDRHLWPEALRLISERRPPVLFGEQVGGRGGREWLAGVLPDLEASGYRACAADLPAAGVGAPQLRSRLWFAAFAVGHPVGGLREQLDFSRVPRDGIEANGVCTSPPDWADAQTRTVENGLSRRFPPGLPMLVDGVPNRLARTRTGIGNSLVPSLAALFVRQSLLALEDTQKDWS